MVVTFLVPVNLESLTDLPSLAIEIEEALAARGLDVAPNTVHPWARPNNPLAQPAGGFTSLTQPEPQIP